MKQEAFAIQAKEIAKVMSEQQANSTPGMKSSVEVDFGTGKMRSEVENTLPSPEVKTTKKSRDRGRNTKQNEDTIKGHKPIEQVTSRTETSNGCVVTDALGAGSREKTKQKDNMEVNQTETPELAQNKVADRESTTRAADGTQGEGDIYQAEGEDAPESSMEDRDNETPATKAAQLIRTMLKGVRAHRKCSCERCNGCQLKNQGFKHSTSNNIKRIVKEIQWPEEIKRMVLVFGHEQEIIKGGRVKARGHLAKVKLGSCQIKFEHKLATQLLRDVKVGEVDI